jgi:uncharacterized surface protein with fasciclin (FAS1) repeats
MFLLIGAVAFVSCDDDDDDVQPAQDIVQLLSDNSDFSLLVDAVTKAGLDTELTTDGPFTLFAPDNTAMQAFLDAAGTNTIEDTPADVLEEVLLTHVLGGSITSGQLNTGYGSTLNPADVDEAVFTTLFIEVNGGVTINGNAQVTNPDIAASNGVIHEIDAVISPPTVVTFATADENFTSLVAALTASGLTTDFVDVLSGDGPFTVFAPTNAAFQALLNTNPDWDSVADIPPSTLESVLRYHVSTEGNVRSEDLTDDMIVTTLSNESFTINLSGASVVIEGGGSNAEVVFTDIQAENGVIHVIDTVLLPE